MLAGTLTVISFASAKEVMFSRALVCLLEVLTINYSTNFPKIRWIGGTWATKKNRFDGNLDHFTLMFSIGGADRPRHTP